MTILTKTLYEYAAARSSAYASLDPEYRSFCAYAQLREDQLRAQFSPEGRTLLDDLLSERANRHSVELEALFQATLALSRELGTIR